ncbi:MAG: L,D-transpeptidase family protein [Gammaproteobacteria bacterium]|nr:L,D-transpeptidase family protein [Gammaproteobacteria bacterium]
MSASAGSGRRYGVVAAMLLSFATQAAVAPARATVYELRTDGSGVFGAVERVRTRYEDTLIELARRYSLGYEELTRVTVGVDPWLPGEGTEIVIPGQRILPPGPRQGVVVNLPEHRLYFFPKPKKGQTPTVMTFPVSVGKMDWRTPIGVTRIVDKRRNPTWTPPESVRREHAARGEPLPKVVGPGPDNPLGAHAMRLAIPGGAYLIHGTNNPDAVGMAVTHGCLRMYPEDVARLFDAVAVGTPVTLINEPVKIARVDGEIWLEVHPPVDAQGQIAEPNIEEFERRLDELLGPTQTAIHWDLALAALREASGIPLVIGLEIPEDESSVPVPGEAPLEGASALPQEGVQGPAPESLPPAPDPVPVPALSDAPAPGPVAN